MFLWAYAVVSVVICSFAPFPNNRDSEKGRTESAKEFFCGVVAIGSFGVLLLGADDPFVGTWKLNVAKSKFTKRQEVKDGTIVITREGDRVAVSFHATDGTGAKLSGKYTVSSAGGTPTYTEGGPPYGLTEKIKRIDDRTVDVISSKDGKEVVTERFTVSPNHKTIIGRVSGVDEKGTPFENVECTTVNS